MEKRVRIITHTGSDLSGEEADKLGICMVPDYVMFGELSYRNQVDITAEEFYRKMEAAPKLPTSSHPSVGDFADVIRQAGEAAGEVLVLTVTSKMSGTYMTAEASAKLLKREGFLVPIFVYDTGQCSHGMAEMVRSAARMAEEGYTAREIIEFLDGFKQRMGVYLVLESLKNARKGGRVGAIKALAADSLGIKPLLVFDEGVVKDIGLCRSYQDGLTRILMKYEEEADRTCPVTVFHADAEEKAEEIRTRILQIQPDVRIRTEPVGPVIGIYTGTGCAGIAFTKKEHL